LKKSNVRATDVPQFKDEFGRPTVSVMGKDRKFTNHSVARLVTEAHVPNPNSYKYIKHLDGNLENCMATNLIWVEKE
jgi:hypothetical protein